MTPAEKLYDALSLAKSEAGLAGRPWGRSQIIAVFEPFLAEFAKGLAKEAEAGEPD